MWFVTKKKTSFVIYPKVPLVFLRDVTNLCGDFIFLGHDELSACVSVCVCEEFLHELMLRGPGL